MTANSNPSTALNTSCSVHPKQIPVAVEGFSASLHTVTKEARSKCRLIGFASSKKIERSVLVTGTKAYKIAAKLIIDAGLAEQKSKQANNKTQSKKKAAHQSLELKPDSKIVGKTAISRTAKRRGYSEDESMSKEELAGLDAALGKNDAEIIQQIWGDQHSEDRWSHYWDC